MINPSESINVNMSNTTKYKKNDSGTVVDLLTTDNTEDDSDELFSDDEEKKKINSKFDVSQNVTDSSRSETPLLSLHNSYDTITSTDAVIPTTPLSLLPFLSKINEQWSSDLETPQAQPHTKISINATKKTEETPKLEWNTPDVSTAKSIDNIVSASPVIVSKATRRRSKRRIFRSSISIDPLALTNNEDIIVNMPIEMPIISEDTSSILQDDSTSITVSLTSTDNVFKDCKSKVVSRTQVTCDNEKSENVTNVPDNLSTSTQEFFNNASFSSIDNLCSITFDNQTTIKNITQYNHKQCIKDIDEERNIENNENIDFVGRPAINISKQTLFRAKRLFADTSDINEMEKIQNYESFTERNSNTQKDLSLFNNVSINVTENLLLKPDSQSTELSKTCDKIHITDYKKPFVNKNTNEEVNMAPVLFSTANGIPIKISKAALSKANALLADELNEDNKDNVLRKHKTPQNAALLLFATTGGKLNNSEKSLSKKKILFAEQLDIINPVTFNEVDISYYKQSDINTSNIGFRTACGKPINISKQALSKAEKLFAEQSDCTLQPIVTKRIYNNEVKNKETKVSKIGFQTAHGKPINISEQALSRAEKLFAEQSDCTTEPIVAKETHNYEVKSEEIKVSKIGFQTARGKSISISEQALSRAEKLFAEQSDCTTEPIVAKETHNYEVKSEEIKVSKIGFQTARGKPISISEQALSRAEKLFAEQSDCTTEPIVAKETHNYEVKSEEIKVSKIGFQTARGKPISISEQALSRAEKLFAEQSDCTTELIVAKETHNYEVKSEEIKVPKIGFQTARGKSISISEQALSRAEKLFAEQSDCTTEPIVAKEVHNYEIKNKEINVSKIGFQTARGKPINISEHALSKAEKLFAEQSDCPSEPMVAKEAHNYKVNNEKTKVSNIGFQTARGTSINISKQALSRAKALFTDELNHSLELDIPKNIDHEGEKVKKCNLKMSRGLQIINSQQVPVSNTTLLNMQALSSNDCHPLDDCNLDFTHTSLQKRKLSEINSDENTFLGRSSASELKKPRLSNELQGTKFISDNMSINTNNDENQNSNEKKQACSVTDSALGSPKREQVEQTNAVANECSPVIGRQSILRKRKSLESQMRVDNENVPSQENIAQENAFCQISENISNTRTHKSTQAERQKAESSNTESSEYSDTQLMMDFINESTKILENRLAAALEQERVINAKKKHGSKQLLSHLYRYKQINSNARLSLKEIGNGASPVPRTCQELIDRQIAPNILAITAATAVSYKFRCSDFYGNDVTQSNIGGIEMDDDVRLILDENGYAGITEFLRAFLASPGVDPNLVPARWIENHYRWIVWKLASMDRMKFGSAELPRALTPSHVMAQLKYRYNREIDRFQRPAIRRILEQDDVSSKRMILCVSSIIENCNVSMEIGRSPCRGVSKWKIEVTDGWYSIPVCIDIGMVRNISTGKVREGTKLVMSGAELLNCDQGFHPLEIPADVYLKLHTNSTRRARWDAKLGYAPRSGPIPIKLRNVCPSGGLIGKMTIVVARVYPILYYEKTASGDSIIRNAKCEERAQSKYERQCWSTVETFYAKAEKDFQGKGSCYETDSMTQLNKDYENLSEGSAKRQGELLPQLRQREERFKQELESKLRESLPGPRQVSQLLKVRVCDENANAILSIWSPSEEVVDAVKEGSCVSLCNVVASGKRGTELTLTACRSAIFKPGKMHDMSYPARVHTSFCEIANSEFAPPYGEFDTVGFVCSVGPAPYGMKDFEAVHLAYPKEDSSDSLYLSILFWQGITGYGYEDILTVGSIVACSNLEWRRATSWNVPAAYCTDRSTFTRNPRRNHLYKSFENLKNLITAPIKYAETCTSELNVELQKKSTPSRYTTNRNTPIKMYNSTSSGEKKLVDYTSPVTTPKMETGNSSSFIPSNPSIQRRLEKLQYYGQPPKLSPIIIKNSKRISLDFRSPIRISTDMSNINRSGNSSSLSTPEKK